jgi:hypothetical protein
MKLAVMQPYLFPYIGYFQLIKAVDKFVFYDDVNFIKNGWINRNRILINGQASYITLPVKDVSSFKLINEISFIDNRNRILKSITLSYNKAPYFKEVFELVEKCLQIDIDKVSTVAINSIKLVSNYLNLKTAFEVSSVKYTNTKGMEREHRLIEICKINHATTYINAIGGVDLYNKSFFNENNIDLVFIKPKGTSYKQYRNDFVPWLSIIDTLMFNSVEDIQIMLDNYELV